MKVPYNDYSMRNHIQTTDFYELRSFDDQLHSFLI